MKAKLTTDEQKVLRRRLRALTARFDTSVRTLAAAALGVTVTLATALKVLSDPAAARRSRFLVSLASNLLSYWTAQRDMRVRLDAVSVADRRGAFGNRWTQATHVLNAIAGLSLLVGRGLLPYFVATAT